MHWLEVYKGLDLEFYGKLDLRHLLARVLVGELGGRVKDAVLAVVLSEPAERHALPGRPELVNLRPDLGYLDVSAVRHGHLLFRHPYPVNDLLGPTLRDYLRQQDPLETYWGFRVVTPSTDNGPVSRPAPPVTGQISVDTGAGRPPVGFRVRRVAEPDPPSLDATTLDIDPQRLSRVSVLLPVRTHTMLAHGMRLSDRTEEGGFLLGAVFCEQSRPDVYIVRVDRVVRARHSGASLIHFTFTGDSFREIARELTADTGATLLGWFHTHLFPADSSLGLSSTDIRLHLGTFQRPFQVAGLINQTREDRVVRFYASRGDSVEECSQWTEHERGRYCPARPLLDTR